MADMKIEDRVRDLERRVGELEGSFQFVSSQLRGVHKSLVDFESETRDHLEAQDVELAGIRNKLGDVDAKFEARLGEMDAKLDAMPDIVASTVAEALRS